MSLTQTSTLERLRAKRDMEEPAGRTGLLQSHWVRAALIVVLTFLVYVPAMRSGFVWDDDRFLTENPLIHASDGIMRFWTTSEAPDYFPLTSTMLWIEWRLWDGHPAGFHFINVLLHSLSALLIWQILARLPVPGAWFAALLFALHPVNVMSVAWITERKNTLAMLFYVSSIYFYLRHDEEKRPRPYFLSLFAFLLALLSKTAVVMLPFVLLLICWWRRGRVSGRELALIVPFFLLSIMLSLVTIWFQYEINIAHEVIREEGFPGRMIGAGWAVWFYLSKALVPFGLIFIYTRWTIDPANALSYLPGILSLALLLFFWTQRGRSWGRALFFAWAYFIVTLFPVLGFLDIYFMRFTYTSDHWQYFSIIGILAAVAAAGALAMRTDRIRPLVIAAGGTLLLVYAIISLMLQGSYRDEETLWRRTLKRNPAAFIAHSNLGVILERRGHNDEALEHFEKATELFPEYREALFNLGNVYFEKGRYLEAIKAYERSLAVDSLAPNVHNNMGNALRKANRHAEAIAAFEEAIRLLPDYMDAYNNLGLAHAESGNEDAALQAYDLALRLDPSHVGALNNRGMLLASLGRHEDSIATLGEALRHAPDDAPTHFNLAGALNLQEQKGEALDHYLHALDLDASLHSARLYAAELAEELDPALSVRLLRDGLSQRPADLELMSRLAWLLCCHVDDDIRDGEEALQLADEVAAASQGTDPRALDVLAAALAEEGHFVEAVTVSQRAIRFAMQGQQQELLGEEMATRLALYKNNVPYRVEIAE